MRSSSYTGNSSERRRSPDGSGVNREVHAPFCERPGVKLLRPTCPAVNTNMVRPNGWSPRGVRLAGHVPMAHWQTLTFIAGFRQTGIVAPMVIKGAMNGQTFLAYIEQYVVPTLKRRDIVVIDNVPFHKTAGVPLCRNPCETAAHPDHLSRNACHSCVSRHGSRAQHCVRRYLLHLPIVARHSHRWTGQSRRRWFIDTRPRICNREAVRLHSPIRTAEPAGLPAHR
jgi:hypothetical protein